MYTFENETKVDHSDQISIVIKRDDEIDVVPRYSFCLVFADGSETNDFGAYKKFDDAVEAARTHAAEYEADPDAER